MQKLIGEFREILTDWLMENSSKIGSLEDIVEIDESEFGRKYNRGWVTKTQWVLGGICRRTKKCFLKVVDKHDANTLNHVTLDNGEPPWTTIVTDRWCGYNLLKQYGYTHLSVNYSLNFVCPRNSAVHTQMTESQWSKIKHDMWRRIGRMSVCRFQMYLIEYIWRNVFISFWRIV